MRKIFIPFFAIIFSACGISVETDTKLNKSGEENSTGISFSATTVKEYNRIVSLNGTITETLFALGKGAQVVGVDATSTFPSEVEAKTNLGHFTKLQAEGIISLQPDLIIAKEQELKTEMLEQLKSANIEVELIKQDFSLEGTKSLISKIGAIVDRKEKATDLISVIEKDLEQIELISPIPTAMFIYARGVGAMNVGGENTSVARLIVLAGGKNGAIGFNNFKPLTPEAMVSANPDAIIFFKRGMESLQGEEGLLKVPSIAATKAGKNKKFIAMDGQLIAGFGPRLGKAAISLNQKLKNL